MPLRRLAIAALLALPLAALATEPNIQPGEWELTSTTRFIGTPMPEQKQSTTECLTREDLADGLVFDVDVEDCQITDKDMRRDGMSYSMTCAQEDGFDMVMNAEMQFLGNRTQGTVAAEMNTPMGAMKMEVLLEGTRIGDC